MSDPNPKAFRKYGYQAETDREPPTVAPPKPPAPNPSQRMPEDVLTARQLVEQYGLAPRVAESIVRSLLRQGKGVESPIRRRLVRRGDVFPDGQSSGGTTCE